MFCSCACRGRITLTFKAGLSVCLCRCRMSKLSSNWRPIWLSNKTWMCSSIWLYQILYDAGKPHFKVNRVYSIENQHPWVIDLFALWRDKCFKIYCRVSPCLAPYSMVAWGCGRPDRTVFPPLDEQNHKNYGSTWADCLNIISYIPSYNLKYWLQFSYILIFAHLKLS